MSAATDTGRVIAGAVAGVRTAAVELRVVTVNKKTLTMATFRQLPDVPVIDPDSGDLVAEPWGWVNYVRLYSGWGSVSDPQNHLNAIWVDSAGRLCRSELRRKERPPELPECRRLSDAASEVDAEAYRLALIAVGRAMAAGGRIELGPEKTGGAGSGWVRVRCGGWSVSVCDSSDRLQSLVYNLARHPDWGQSSHRYERDGYAAWRSDLPKLVQAKWQECGGEGEPTETRLGDDYVRKQGEAGRLRGLAAVARSRYEASFDAVLASGQLFIAT